jgi:hypothetical protein
MHKIKVVVMVDVISSQGCASKFYANRVCKAKPKIGMKARAKSAYKKNP